MRAFVIRWFITAASVFIAAPVAGIDYQGSMGCLLTASLLLGAVNAFIRPVLLMISLPLIVVSLGFFILIINALMLGFVGLLLPCFHVNGFWSAFFGSILISVVSWIISAFFRGKDGRIQSLNQHPRIKKVQGRVIDI